MSTKQQLKKQLKHQFQHTLLLPKTSFPMRANASTRENEYVRRSTTDLYRWQRHRSHKRRFVLHDGPPYANGDLHVGHFLNKVLKDMINRYHVLNGRQVAYVPGWDCHGLPIELKALRQLRENDDGGGDITPQVIRRTARACAEEAIASQRDDMIRWGIMADWGHGDDEAPPLIEREYHSMDPQYEAEQLRVLADLVRNGFIKRGFKPVYWSPSSKTALAEAELEYEPAHRSTAVYVRFPFRTLSNRANAVLRDVLDEHDDVAAVIWTTTPWTLPANMALCIRETLDYAVLRMPSSSTYVVVASDLVEDFTKQVDSDRTEPFETVAIISGHDLVGSEACHPLRQSDDSSSAHPQKYVPIISGDHVTSDSGTGIVHTAPAHGADDFAVYASYLSRSRDQMSESDVLAMVGDDGRFTATAGAELEGKDVLGDGTDVVLDQLRSLDALVAVDRNYVHRYPYDWRTKRPVIVRAMQQWFTNLTGADGDEEDGLVAKASRALEHVHAVPENGQPRLRATLKSRSEWCISRQRAWGVPIPAWHDAETGETVLTPEMAEHLSTLVESHERGTDCWWELSDEELLPPSMRSRAGSLSRTYDTLDVWFDSGVSWASVLRARCGESGPADVYLEGTDQHRGWFQSSLLTSVALTGASPYKTLISHGFVVDGNGRKMSKSVGNVVSPQDIVSGPVNGSATSRKETKKKKKKGQQGKNKNQALLSQGGLGADALRVWAASSNYTVDVAIGEEQIQKATDALRKLRNVARFILGNTHDLNVPIDDNSLRLRSLDRYMLQRIDRTQVNVAASYEQYDFKSAFRHVLDFCTHDLSSFYFDASKDLLYSDRMDASRRRATQVVMMEALRMMTLAIAPVTCFTAEDIYAHVPRHHREMYWNDDEIGVETDAASVFYQRWSRPRAGNIVGVDVIDNDENLVRTWDELREIRSATMGLLERARTDGHIRSSLDAALTMTWLDDPSNCRQREGVMVSHLRDAEDTFAVSQTRFVSAGGEELINTSPVTTSDALSETLCKTHIDTSAGPAEILISRASGGKCDRCWKHCDSVSPVDASSGVDGGCVCARCRGAIM